MIFLNSLKTSEWRVGGHTGNPKELELQYQDVFITEESKIEMTPHTYSLVSQFEIRSLAAQETGDLPT